ncbi:MAG: Oligopeptide-binding protein OppA [Chlamydiia bacterium]|nr:Oligopeptide-binding protein OppA [Chlamydiia bacterium]
MKRIRIIQLFLLLGVAFCLPSCTQQKRAKNTLRLNLAVEPATLDFRKAADYSTVCLDFLIYEGITRATPESMGSLAIAEKVEISNDNKTYTFYLKDAKYSDGTPISSYDFKYAWETSLDSQFPCPSAFLFYPIKNAKEVKLAKEVKENLGLSCPDSKTLVVSLEAPTPYLLQLISFINFCPMPMHWKDKDGSAFPPTSGAFYVESWKDGDQVVLRKNPHYWDAENVHLEEVHISFINDDMTALSLFQNGDLDLLGNPFSNIPLDAIEHLKKTSDLHSAPIAASTICTFNLENPTFANKNIRKALALAINRRAIVENICQLNETPALNIIPPVMWDRQEQYFADYDRESANQFLELGLKELGLTRDTLNLSLIYGMTNVYPKIALALQACWKEVLGIHVGIEGFEYKIFMDKLNRRDYQIAECIWIAQYHDPMNIFERFEHPTNTKNYPGFSNENYRQLVQASLLAQSEEERFSMLSEAEKILIEEMPITVLYHWNKAYLANDSVKNLRSTPGGGFCLNELIVEGGGR